MAEFITVTDTSEPEIDHVINLDQVIWIQPYQPGTSIISLVGGDKLVVKGTPDQVAASPRLEPMETFTLDMSDDPEE